MTNYTRLTGKVFGSSATATGDDPEIGQFGSALAGTYNGTTDVATIQSLPAWQKGFIGCVTPNTQFPPLPEMTGVGKVLSYQICYLLQKGIPAWDSGTTYYTNDWCAYNGKLYISKTDENLNNLPTNTTYWDKFTGGFSRNYGEIVTSSLPLIDSTLHLADGSVLSATNYPEFVSYVANLYNALPTGDFSQAVQNTNLGNNEWTGITYGNGKYVAVDNKGYYSTSTNGNDWSARTQILNITEFTSIAYGGGIFVAVTIDGIIVTSQDAVNWTKIGTGSTIGNEDWSGITFGFLNGQNIFMAISYDGKIATSSNGTSWNITGTAVVPYSNWIGITYGEGKFLVINGSGYVYYTSTSASQWTNVSYNLGSHNWKDINYNGYVFEAISFDGYFSSSVDGFTWQTATQDTNLGENSWTAIANNGTKSVAISYTGYISIKEQPYTEVFTTEAEWQTSYTTYGECGKYVYNPGANTVRIPLYNTYLTNTVNPLKLGDLTEASLPNIKGVISANERLYKSGTSVSDYGAFNNYAQNVVSGQSDNTNFDNDLWDFDASRVSRVYSDSATTVNTQSIKQLVYIVVAK